MEIYCLRNERNDKVACGLCSMFREEKHDFSLSGGAKAEAVIESSDAKTYYETFEKAAAAVSQNDTLKLCFDADCTVIATTAMKNLRQTWPTLTALLINITPTLIKP